MGLRSKIDAYSLNSRELVNLVSGSGSRRRRSARNGRIGEEE